MDVLREETGEPWPHRLFVGSLTPMLLVDDERRCVDANPAACLFLRLPHTAICKLRIDDLTPPALRPGLDALWKELLQRPSAREGMQALGWVFLMPDGTSLAVDLSSTSHAGAARRGVLVTLPSADVLTECSQARTTSSYGLTKRERQILKLVALGNTGVEIAAALFLSPTTVQTHMVNTLTKLGARNRAHGIAIAVRTGELDFDDSHEPRFLDFPTRSR